MTRQFFQSNQAADSAHSISLPDAGWQSTSYLPGTERVSLYQFTSSPDLSQSYLDVPEFEYPSGKKLPAHSGVMQKLQNLDARKSVREYTESGIFESIEVHELRDFRRQAEIKCRCIPPMFYRESDRYSTSSLPNPISNGRLNYYNFSGGDQLFAGQNVSDKTVFLPVENPLKIREQLAPGEMPSIRIEYEDRSKSAREKTLVPDFRITTDGRVQILNDPEINPYKEIVIEVERASGFVGLPTEEQQKALSSLTKYLSERIKLENSDDPSAQIQLSDQQGLLPEEASKAINPAPQPEDSLPTPAQGQTEALNRINGSGNGSMSSSDAGDYFPSSEVPPLPEESPNLSALKDLVAGFATRGLAEPYTAVQDRGDRGFAVGRYGLTASTIFDWIEGLSDGELGEFEELEITTADGKKRKIKIPKDTGAKLKKIRDLLKTMRNRAAGKDGSTDQSASAEDQAESDKAMEQLFSDPQIRDFTRLLVQMQEGKEKPSAEQINAELGPEMQELIATNLIYKFAKESTDPQTQRVDIGQVVLSMQLGRAPTAEELQSPANQSLMDAADRGYPLALQHTNKPNDPVTWQEVNGKVASDPNSYFFSQFRNATYNPTGPASSNNCGPASLAMAAKAFAKDGGVQNIEQQIDRARQAMTGRTNDKELTSLAQIAAGAKKMGMQAAGVSDINAVNNALDSGRQVVLFGNPAGAYGNRLSGSQYSHYNGLHFILVAEKSGGANGNSTYTINDPLSRKGSISISSTELQRYMRRDAQGRTGIAVWA